MSSKETRTKEAFDRIAKYYTEVRPGLQSEFLKEKFLGLDGAVLDDLISKRQPVQGSPLDGIFVREAMEFLRVSIFNLLAFKNLMCGNYYSWGKVTLYYSNFYVVNCMLRLNGFAIVHVKHSKGPAILLERDYPSRAYSIGTFGKGDHAEVWRRFTETFPGIMSRELYRVDIEDREMWNYDPRYFSQATDRNSLAMAKYFCDNNFLSENFENSATSIEDAERRFDLMSSFGYEEGATGYNIRKAIELIGKVGKFSQYKKEYVADLASISKGMELFEVKAETRDEVRSWLTQEIDAMK